MDGDEHVFTDNVYASTDKDILLPEGIILRLPDGNTIDFLNFLIENLGSLFEDEKTFGYTAKVWLNATKEVFLPIIR